LHIGKFALRAAMASETGLPGKNAPFVGSIECLPIGMLDECIDLPSFTLTMVDSAQPFSGFLV
jgi:hypothetical protein